MKVTAGKPPGFALLTAIFAIVLLIPLAASSALLLKANTRTSAVKSAILYAQAASENGVWLVVSRADSLKLDTLGVFASFELFENAAGVETKTFVTRVDTSMYWIVSTASATIGRNRARRKVGLWASAMHVDSILTLKPVPLMGWASLY